VSENYARRGLSGDFVTDDENCACVNVFGMGRSSCLAAAGNAGSRDERNGLGEDGEGERLGLALLPTGED